MTQADLFAQKAPTVSDQDVAWLLRALDGRGWVNARALICWGATDRRLRAIAAASQGQIVSGQRGYARTDQASVEDVNHAMSWLRSQSRSMATRANEIQQVLNGRLARSA